MIKASNYAQLSYYKNNIISYIYVTFIPLVSRFRLLFYTKSMNVRCWFIEWHCYICVIALKYLNKKMGNMAKASHLHTYNVFIRQLEGLEIDQINNLTFIRQRRHIRHHLLYEKTRVTRRSFFTWNSKKCVNYGNWKYSATGHHVLQSSKFMSIHFKEWKVMKFYVFFSRVRRMSNKPEERFVQNDWDKSINRSYNPCPMKSSDLFGSVWLKHVTYNVHYMYFNHNFFC